MGCESIGIDSIPEYLGQALARARGLVVQPYGLGAPKEMAWHRDMPEALC